MDELWKALKAGRVRYTHEHGEPYPSIGIPFEVAFTIPQWQKVEEEFRKLIISPEETVPMGTSTVTTPESLKSLRVIS